MYEPDITEEIEIVDLIEELILDIEGNPIFAVSE
tara:strand:- start:519 stop:620 length:102 start_codon:yes stop_codon:yes gene_type:complete